MMPQSLLMETPLWILAVIGRPAINEVKYGMDHY
ncbi:MAG: hypothetical protein JSC085_000761 [Candidatus Tokpelaia sp. JSC085]|nr:MAG: hypothetical protein JSC085_000761 [Candidatus Tokpelaia sp. JSC085]